MNRSTLISLLFLFIVGSLTFSIKQIVLELETEIADVKKQMVRYEEALHILNAEWAYLNQPERLQALAEEKLGLNLGDHFQFVSVEKVGADPASAYTLPESDMLHLASARSDAR